MLPLVAVLFGVLTGCAGNEFPTVPVSGRVTLDGQPLAAARVVFEPLAQKTNVAGPGSSGVTGADGRFVLATADGRPGAVPGLHRVRITTLQTKPDPRSPDELIIVSPEKVPPRYNQKSTQKFDVPAAGTEAADFALLTR